MSHNLPESTAVAFVQENPKKAGGKSYDRYERYKSGTTIQGALALGMLKGDIVNDHRNGYMKCVDEAVNNEARGSLEATDNLKKFKAEALVRIKALEPNPMVVGAWAAAQQNGGAFTTDPSHFGFVVKVLNVNQASPNESRVSIRMNSSTADAPVIQEFLVSELAIVTLSEYKEMRFSLPCPRCNLATVAGKVMCQCYGKKCLSCIHVRCLGPAEPLDRRGHHCQYCQANGFQRQPGPRRPQDQQAAQPAPGQEAIRPERERQLELMAQHQQMQAQQMQAAAMGHPMPAPQMQGVPPAQRVVVRQMPPRNHLAPDFAERQQRLLAEQERQAAEQFSRMTTMLVKGFGVCRQLGIHEEVFKEVGGYIQQEVSKASAVQMAREREEEREAPPAPRSPGGTELSYEEAQVRQRAGQQVFFPVPGRQVFTDVAPADQAMRFGAMPAPVQFGGQPSLFAAPPPQPGFNYQAAVPKAAPAQGHGVMPMVGVGRDANGRPMFAARDADGQPPAKKAMHNFGSSLFGPPSGSFFGASAAPLGSPGFRFGDSASSASSAHQHLVPNPFAAPSAPAQVKAEPAEDASQDSAPGLEEASQDAASDREFARHSAEPVEDNVLPKANAAYAEQGVREAVQQAPVPRE